jgi:hypothetical protein
MRSISPIPPVPPAFCLARMIAAAAIRCALARFSASRASARARACRRNRRMPLPLRVPLPLPRRVPLPLPRRLMALGSTVALALVSSVCQSSARGAGIVTPAPAVAVAPGVGGSRATHRGWSQGGSWSSGLAAVGHMVSHRVGYRVIMVGSSWPHGWLQGYHG